MIRSAKNRCSTAAVLAVILALGSISYGQALTAVTGRVTDATSGVIPGVEITVTNTATGAVRSVITNETGMYSVTQLAPGTYNIKAELPGFKPKAANNVALPVGLTITLDLSLEVGAVTDVVDVTASAEAVNTENAQLGNAFDSKKILELPLNARNIVALLSLQTGVTEGSGEVNGARSDQQNIVLDGVDNNRQQAGSAFAGVLPTTLDSVQAAADRGASQPSSRTSRAPSLQELVERESTTRRMREAAEAAECS